MKTKQPRVVKKKTPDRDMMEAFNISPWYSVGKILPTSTNKKEDVFDSYRPKRHCVDYKISETWAKMQAKDVKINIKQTSATYEEIPHEVCNPHPRKKKILFSGGPPQWKFVDEIWREQREECQNHLRKEHRKTARAAKAARANKLKDKHAIVQRLVGPEWFMELSPKQLQAIDQLGKSMFLDLKERSIENCEDILASLGLVLRPNKKHVSKALQHSCGCPVEFLLVLYQIMDPKRQSYSLNDRLLLSAVVHLSTTQTLRELHVRIPSPPRTEKVKLANGKKRKKVKVEYDSPYLEPLTYNPAPPKYSGTYTNKHKQHPESPYFSYLKTFEKERRLSTRFSHSVLPCNESRKAEMREYNEAQDFYSNLPGAKKEMLNLLHPSQVRPCPNLLHPSQKTAIPEKFIAPHLCKVTISEPIVCFCEENRQKQNLKYKIVRRSCCEQHARKFLQSSCLCDDCLEKVAQKNLIRIHGGVQKSPCKCDEPVPIIQGTVLNTTCECYKEYRNKMVGAAARQYLTDHRFKYCLGGVIMTKLGPVYNILATLGEKICLCGEIRQRKIQIKHIQATLCNNKAKFSISGVSMTKMGPVYNLTAVVARKPCKCILNYRAKLNILKKQNEIRKNPNCFVNHGIVNGKRGPVFYFSRVVLRAAKTSSDLRTVCSCEIKKPRCFQRCFDYLEYKVSDHTAKSSSEDSECDSEESESESEEATSSETSSGGEERCPYCSQDFTKRGNLNGTQRSCLQTQKHAIQLSNNASCSKSETSSHESDESKSASNVEESTTTDDQTKKSTSTSDYEDFFTPKPCTCKDELDRFMKAKCPCDECNNKIRRGYATYVMGGTTTAPSGNQINVVTGVQQPVCGCMHEHLENIRKIDEYKSRVKARYDLKMKPDKYCISGVKNTPDGPVYIISGLRPPVDCECAKALREKQENEEFEKQRAKMPNTGRNKYEISGVRAIPGENVYILSRALNITECECVELLARFEGLHRPCMKELEKYLAHAENEIKEFIEEMDQQVARRGTLLNTEDIKFDMEQQKLIKSNMEMGVSIDGTGAQQEEIDDEKGAPLESQEDHEQPSDNGSLPSKKSADTKCLCAGETSESDETSSDDETSLDTETSSSENSSSEDDVSECGSCHVENPPEVKPITIPTNKDLPESFLSKRFAIFRKFPKDRNKQMHILRHILEGMADDGFPLAKLPQVYKLPIFKLWLQLRSGVTWDYEDRLRYFGRSKNMWRHTFVCYTPPFANSMPFSMEEAQKMTWNNANLIRRVAAEQRDKYYRKVKQVTVDTGREFFPATFSYEFPTIAWRDCAFAYIPTKEEDVFAYKIVQPHDTRIISENKKIHCYC